MKWTRKVILRFDKGSWCDSYLHILCAFTQPISTVGKKTRITRSRIVGLRYVATPPSSDERHKESLCWLGYGTVWWLVPYRFSA